MYIIDGPVQVEDEGIYMCIAEHLTGSSAQTININVVGKFNVKFFPTRNVENFFSLVPSGPRSRVFIYLSVPDIDDRLPLRLEEVESFPQIIEQFLVSYCNYYLFKHSFCLQ